MVYQLEYFFVRRTVRGIHDWSQHFNRRRQLGTYIHKYIYILARILIEYKVILFHSVICLILLTKKPIG